MGFFMAIKTTLEQLEEVQTAISHVMNGQQVSIAGKNHTMADLTALSRREEILLRRYEIENNTGGPSINSGITRRD